MKDFSKYAGQAYEIIGAAFAVYNELGRGLLEAIYEEAMGIELEAKGIHCNMQEPLHVFYKGRMLEKQYRVDISTCDILVELKSVKEIISDHRAQLCNYLRLTKKPVGLLVNFGGKSLYGERWGFDEKTNECFKLDRNMLPIEDEDPYYDEEYDDRLEE